MKSGKCISMLTKHTQPVYAVAISPDNKYIATGSLDESVNIWIVQDDKMNEEERERDREQERDRERENENEGYPVGERNVEVENCDLNLKVNLFKTFNCKSGGIFDLSWSFDCSKLAACNSEGKVLIFEF